LARPRTKLATWRSATTLPRTEGASSIRDIVPCTDARPHSLCSSAIYATPPQYVAVLSILPVHGTLLTACLSSDRALLLPLNDCLSKHRSLPSQLGSLASSYVAGTARYGAHIATSPGMLALASDIIPELQPVAHSIDCSALRVRFVACVAEHLVLVAPFPWLNQTSQEAVSPAPQLRLTDHFGNVVVSAPSVAVRTRVELFCPSRCLYLLR
jgi:hypothetical protein